MPNLNTLFKYSTKPMNTESELNEVYIHIHIYNLLMFAINIIEFDYNLICS